VGCLSRFGLGRSFRRERLRWKMPKARPQKPTPRPLAHDVSAGCAPARALEQGARSWAQAWPPATRSCTDGRPSGRCAGFDRSSGRARGLIRLQKSTSGVRPVVSFGEEPGEYGGGSSFQGRELSRKRNDVGSQTVGGKVAGLVAGSQKIAPAKVGTREHLSMEGALSRESRSC
jgi:hypothetical protein